MSRVMRRIVRAGRNSELIWRCLFNLAPTLAYTFNRSRLDGEARRVLESLNRDGVAMTTASSLFGSNSSFDELSTSVAHAQQELAAEIEDARLESANTGSAGTKSFIHALLGEYPRLDPGSIYARFALQSSILKIANAYLGMCTRLRYYNVWHTFVSNGEPRQSQLWHRDREDHYIVKVFVYLTDVDDGSGPFTYAPGTHGKGNVRGTPAYSLEGVVRRTSDTAMSEVVPEDRWVKCVGERGTIVFADTRGYHKGGFALERDRIMYTCMFTSPASESEEFFKRQNVGSQAQNRRDLAFALAPPRGGPWLTLGKS
jgi:Phytanoyl-CoA dioxygenase (PhyH)